MALGLTGSNPIILNVCEVRKKKSLGQLDPEAKLGPKLFGVYSKQNIAGRDMVSAAGQWIIVSAANGRYISYPPSLGPTRAWVDTLLNDVRVAWLEMMPYPALGSAKSATPGPITAITVKNDAEFETELSKANLVNLCSVTGVGGEKGPPVFTKIWTTTDVLVALGFASLALATGAYFAIPQFKALVDGLKDKASGQDLSKFITPDIVQTAEGFYGQYIKTQDGGGNTSNGQNPTVTGDTDLIVVFRGGGEIKVKAKRLSNGTVDFRIDSVPVIGTLDINFSASEGVIKPSGGLSWLGGVFKIGASEIDKSKGILWFKLPFVSFEFGVKVERAPANTISQFLPYVVVGGALLAGILLFKRR